jgi:hypothetical protein
MVQQSEVLKWVKEHPEMYRGLSPLRKEMLSLSLMDKLKWESIPETKAAPRVPSHIVSKPRPLPVKLSGIHLTLEDEQALLERPDMVPVTVRSEIHSLVWLALVDQKSQKEILSQLSAQNLAEIWIGPSSVLKDLQRHIPEKKFKIAQEYSSKMRASRESAAMQFVVRESLSRLESSGAQVIEIQSSTPSKRTSGASDSDAA